MTLKITVCEFRDDPDGIAQDWEQLVTHLKAESSNVVLFPEMPFYPWFVQTKRFDQKVWQEAVTVHDGWQTRFKELAPATVLGSRPVNSGNNRLNEGFIWDQEFGYRAAHHKYYLPDEEGYWEASWYHRGNGEFNSIGNNTLQIGFLICTELWFMECARNYGKSGVHLVVTPRATGSSTLENWLLGGRTAAIVSGAYSLSSNRVSSEGASTDFGGQGWIIGPDGQVLALTSRQEPFVTVEIDVSEAERAKQKYPRYISE